MIKDGKNHTRKELEEEAQRLSDLVDQLQKKRTRKWTDIDRELDKAKRQLSYVRKCLSIGRHKKEGK
tara:strand:+ start:814 stop:1014 length:201 start_codon:yes stop_codon:yes gene_type:complete